MANRPACPPSDLEAFATASGHSLRAAAYSGTASLGASVGWHGDLSLAGRLARGEAGAWRAWVPKCRELLSRIAARAGIAVEERDDLTQNVLAELWTRRSCIVEAIAVTLTDLP